MGSFCITLINKSRLAAKSDTLAPFPSNILTIVTFSSSFLFFSAIFNKLIPLNLMLYLCGI